MELGTLRMILRWKGLWAALKENVKVLPERQEVGKALSPEEETRLLEACQKSPSPSLDPAIIAFCNTRLRNAELRCARCSQVDSLHAEFEVAM